MNATLGRRLGPRTNVNITAIGELTRSRSLQGAATALFRLDPANPASVFSQAVNVARYLPVPLEAKRQGGGANLAATINHNLGKWTGTLSLNYNHREDRTLTDRGVDTAALQAAIDANLFSPFAEVPNAFLGISRRDVARSNSDLASAQATLTGPAVKLPTGEIMVSLRGWGRHPLATFGKQRLARFDTKERCERAGVGRCAPRKPAQQCLGGDRGSPGQSCAGLAKRKRRGAPVEPRLRLELATGFQCLLAGRVHGRGHCPAAGDHQCSSYCLSKRPLLRFHSQ
ncbi:hypothetical protein [Novosphingobium sp. ES2-1]|uniref:hypothetical protein n=1 Tax=Novosphingobium sp. ES2-1 TaxID=2780074 RepID=UPI00188145AE|nr:hypothetical protein [Novosphingobium sp. ES2-1]QOV94876.1 hypothetical protein IM701_05385 [Novosphingobium sp. ES2-1]